MWCFFDESYPTEGGVTSVVACLLRTESIRSLDAILYKAQRRHYGTKRARDLAQELKGNMIFSNYAFKMLKKHGYSTNLEVAADILRDCACLPNERSIRIFGAAIYGGKDVLKKVHKGKLGFPIVELLKRVSCAAKEMEPSRSVNLVFDESLTDRSVSMSIRRFVSGVKLDNVSHYPLIGVSHVSPGIQLADIGAYIVGRRAVGDRRFQTWLSQLRNLEWNGIVNGYLRYGIQRWDSDGSERVTVRKRWELE